MVFCSPSNLLISVPGYFYLFSHPLCFLLFLFSSFSLSFYVRSFPTFLTLLPFFLLLLSFSLLYYIFYDSIPLLYLPINFPSSLPQNLILLLPHFCSGSPPFPRLPFPGITSSLLTPVQLKQSDTTWLIRLGIGLFSLEN